MTPISAAAVRAGVLPARRREGGHGAGSADGPAVGGALVVDHLDGVTGLADGQRRDVARPGSGLHGHGPAKAGAFRRRFDQGFAQFRDRRFTPALHWALGNRRSVLALKPHGFVTPVALED